MIFYYCLNRNQVLKPCMRQAVWEANNRYILHSYFPRRREYCWACWEPMSAVSPISSRDFAKSAAPQPKKGCRSDRQVWEWQSWSTSVGFESANGLKLWNTGIDSVNIPTPYRYWEKMAKVKTCERQCDREISWPCRICRAWAAQCAKMCWLSGWVGVWLSWCLARGAGIWQQLLWVGIVVGRFFFFDLQSAPNRNQKKHLLFLFSPWQRIQHFLWCTCNVDFTWLHI